jgi:chromosome segregation ATPase
MEEHGGLKAHLRQKEHELSEASGQLSECRRLVEDLETRLRASEDKVGRSERRVILAERESSFLQAMMVC